MNIRDINIRDWDTVINPSTCPRCNGPYTAHFTQSGSNAGLESHWANFCPTMYVERMLGAFLDRLERILAGWSK